MINFNQIVKKMLFEQEATANTLAFFYDDQSQLALLRNFLTQTFGIQTTWPSAASVFPILQDTYVRPRVESIVPFADKYPLIDFVWYVVDQNKQDAKILNLKSNTIFDQSQIDQFEQNFINAIKKNNAGINLNPLFGYMPLSSKAVANQKPLQKKISNSIVGKMSLDNFKTFGLKKALYGILENRKKIRTAVIKNKNIPSAVKWIDKILNEPQSYAGQKQIPSEIKAVYDRVTGEVLIEIANAFHDFYESETSAAEQGVKNSNVNKSPVTTFDDFISNDSLVSNRFIFKFKPGGLAYSPHGLNLQGGYTVENVRKINTPQAKAVINILTTFASYVREGEPTELLTKIVGTLSGVTQIAKGLSLGVPTMGR